MCDCKKKNETKIFDLVSKQLPEGAKHLAVNLMGYGLIFGDNSCVSRQVMEVKITYSAPNRQGEYRAKRKSESLVANYCMFCGEKYPVDEPNPSASDSVEVA